MAISASIKTLLKGEQVAGSKMSRQLTYELMAEGQSKAMVLAAMVETYAVLALLISILMILNLNIG